MAEYLRDRYVLKRWRLVDIADELDTNPGRIDKLLRAHGLGPRKGHAIRRDSTATRYAADRLQAARTQLAERQATADAELAAQLGYPSLGDWYRARRQAGATQAQMCSEAGRSEKWLRRVKALAAP